MSVTAWRIVKRRHGVQAFSGEGARRYGGRWNSKGTPMVYTAGSISLATLELLVHLHTRDVLTSYVLFEVTMDEQLVTRLDRARLPKNWRKSPAPKALQLLGDEWVDSVVSPVLEVPSAIIEEESNYLLNPAHQDFPHLTIGKPKPFRFDRRLV